MTVKELIKLLEKHAEDESEINVNGGTVEEIQFIFSEQVAGAECIEVNIC